VSRTERADELRAGPLGVGVPAAAWLLVAASCLLALTGTGLHAAAVLRPRVVEVARLQALGMPRRDVVAALVAEHAVLTSLGVALGALLGALATWQLAPLMTVSDTGALPVPSPAPAWPWFPESVLVAGLVIGCAAVAVPVALVLARRADAAHLRLDGGA
jgi:predicted lysophospholipase L1 biosynthesis ABC-type transport system permease subunit